MNDDISNKDLREVERRFKDAGLKVTIGGCGCCGSPWIKVEDKDGFVFEGDNATLNMFGDDP